MSVSLAARPSIESAAPVDACCVDGTPRRRPRYPDDSAARHPLNHASATALFALFRSVSFGTAPQPPAGHALPVDTADDNTTDQREARLAIMLEEFRAAQQRRRAMQGIASWNRTSPRERWPSSYQRRRSSTSDGFAGAASVAPLAA